MKITDKKGLFMQMHPGYFDQVYIRALSPERVFEEMTLDLHAFSCDQVAIPMPQGITFGMFPGGDMSGLLHSVRQVGEGWVQYFGESDDIFCAFDGDQVVSFCLLDDMGEHLLDGRKVRVAGPGCVGTIPAYRKRGIGLRMVQLGTQILKDRGYDISYIHFTGVGPWYAKLGYETLLTWNSAGIIDSEPV